MRIIDPSFKILEFDDNAMERIARAARVCYQSESKTDETEFVKRLIRTGHHTPLEMASATVEIVCDRGVSHELVRHRLASFNQSSTRYCNFSKNKFGNEITVIRPHFWKEGTGKHNEWLSAMQACENVYLNLIEDGATPEQARSVLPNSLATQIIMTANFREFLHIFKLRCSPHAHPQIREIAIPMLKDFWNRCPVIFNELYDAI